MARVQVKLDHAGLTEIITSPAMVALVSDATETIAAAVSGPGLDVETEVGPAVPGRRIRDGRPVGRVTVAQEDGMGRQAKDGVLTRAVSALGPGVKFKGKAS